MTEVAEYHPRIKVAISESTRDPIFLFLTKQITIPQVAFDSMHYIEDHRIAEEGAGGAFLTDDERERYEDMRNDAVMMDSEDPNYPDFKEINVMTDKELVEYGLAVEYWNPMGKVFYTREEGEDYAKARPYKYGEQGKDWKIYCVCAEGELASVLIGGEAKGTNYLPRPKED